MATTWKPMADSQRRVPESSSVLQFQSVASGQKASAADCSAVSSASAAVQWMCSIRRIPRNCTTVCMVRAEITKNDEYGDKNEITKFAVQLVPSQRNSLRSLWRHRLPAMAIRGVKSVGTSSGCGVAPAFYERLRRSDGDCVGIKPKRAILPGSR